MGEVTASPKVSVCVPAYQAGRSLGETLSSILAQDHDDFEVVVRDNANTDGTRAVLDGIDDPRLRVVRGELVLPLAQNWRACVAEARGQYIKLVCADDLIAPQAVRLQAQVLDAHPDVALVAARRSLIDAHSQVLIAQMGLRGLIGRHDGLRVARTLVRRGGINAIGEPAGVMFRKADYDEVGGWDARWTHPMDIDLWMRLLHLGALVGQPETLASFRVHDGAHSAAHDKQQYQEFIGLTALVAQDWGVPVLERFTGAALRRAVWHSWTVRKQWRRVRRSVLRPKP